MSFAAKQPSRIVSVSEFAQRLHNVFRRINGFDYIGITGEISDWSPKSYGVFFTIKDADAVLQCFAHSNHARRFPKVALGTAVVAYGSVQVSPKKSQYSLAVEVLELTGVGALYAEYEALKERFRVAGFFASERKRPIPRFPHHVVLVSAAGKGAEDFQKVMRERAPHVNVEFIETRVQGTNAEAEIADAIDRAARRTPDAIVVARGGGSYEDLFAFNREPVVRAILRCPVPVITGIGHTGDHHLADDVADLSCETPSNAAQYLANLWQRGNQRLERLSLQLDREMRDLLARALQRGDAAAESLPRAMERAIMRRRERLMTVEHRLTAQSPSQQLSVRVQRLVRLRAQLENFPSRLSHWKTRLDSQAARLRPAWERFSSAREHGLAIAVRGLDSLDPNAPLARGYAMIERDGTVVRSASDVAPGDFIVARVGRGRIDARVEAVHDE